MICQKFVIFISHRRSWVWTRYFISLCIIISSTCVIFLVNLDDFFAVVCTGFHEVVVWTRYVPNLSTLNWGSVQFSFSNIFIRIKCLLAILIDRLEEFQSTILKTQDSHVWNLQTNNCSTKHGRICYKMWCQIFRKYNTKNCESF